MRAGFALALLLIGCSSPSITGGDPVRAGREPPGKVLRTYVTKDCKDAKGVAWAHPARLFLVKDSEGFEFLVAAEAGLDSLVIRNHYTEGSESVFQAVLDASEGHPVLHDYRIPAKGKGDGRMAVAFNYSETESDDQILRAKVLGAAFACRLAEDEEEPPDGGS